MMISLRKIYLGFLHQNAMSWVRKSRQLETTHQIRKNNIKFESDKL